MFIQFITARVKDAAGVKRTVEKWDEMVGQKATGFLGTTAGMTKDGDFVVVARFESERAANKNSDLAEQTAWWHELEKSIENPQFLNCTQVEQFGEGGSDSAGFVQIITGRGKDVERLKQIDKEMDTEMTRPDVIGGTVGWSGDRFVQTIYFTSEAEARENEAKPLEGRAKELMEEMQSLGEDVRFYDLSEPILVSP